MADIRSVKTMVQRIRQSDNCLFQFELSVGSLGSHRRYCCLLLCDEYDGHEGLCACDGVEISDSECQQSVDGRRPVGLGMIVDYLDDGHFIQARAPLVLITLSHTTSNQKPEKLREEKGLTMARPLLNH